MNSPILSAITQGGNAAQQGFSAATRAAAMAGNSFNKGASMALKMDQLLQEEEDRLYNKQKDAQKTLLTGIQQARENQFKEQSATLAQQRANDANSRHAATLAQTKIQNAATDKYRSGMLKNAENTLAFNKDNKKDELKLKKDAIDFTTKALGGGSTGGATISAPTTLSTGTNGGNRTNSDMRRNISNQIDTLRSQAGSVQAFPAQKAQFDNKIKTLEKEYKRYAPAQADVNKFIQDELDANPDMTREEFTDMLRFKVNASKEFYSADDKKLYSTVGEKAYEKFSKKQADDASRRINYESLNQAKAGTVESNINESLAMIVGRDKNFEPLIKEGFQDITDSKTNWIADRSALEYGVGGLGDDERRAVNVLNYMMKNPKFDSLFAKDRYNIGKMNEDKKQEYIEDILSKEKDTIRELLKYR